MTCTATAGQMVEKDKDKDCQTASSSTEMILTGCCSPLQEDHQMGIGGGGGGGGEEQMEDGSGGVVISDEDSCMLACLKQLQLLVPTVPPNTQLSQVQLLQHVIDYILDLELTLDYEPPSSSLRSYSNQHLVDIKGLEQQLADPLERLHPVELVGGHEQVQRLQISSSYHTNESDVRHATYCSNTVLINHNNSFNSNVSAVNCLFVNLLTKKI